MRECTNARRQCAVAKRSRHDLSRCEESYVRGCLAIAADDLKTSARPFLAQSQ